MHPLEIGRRVACFFNFDKRAQHERVEKENAMSIHLTVPPKRELKPRIVVFGIGGAGGNAVNNMVTAGLEGVDFVVANTDAQSLSASQADRRIQMGLSLIHI